MSAEPTAPEAHARSSALPLPMPRALIFFASFWLIGSWLLAMGLHTPVHPNSASFTPGVRLMMLCIAVGLMVGWPLMRLSQAPSHWPIRQTLLDAFVLLALAQVVIWPLRLVTIWSAPRMAAMDAALASWALLAGAIIAAAIGTTRPGPRILAMLACIGICIGGPLLTLLGLFADTDWMALVELSPILSVYTLSEGGATPPTAEQWNLLALLAGCVVVVWIALLVATSVAQWRRQSQHN